MTNLGMKNMGLIRYFFLLSSLIIAAIQLASLGTGLRVFKLKLSKLRKHKFCELPEHEKWRINMIKELTNVKLKNLEINFTNNEDLTTKEIDAIIENICTM